MLKTGYELKMLWNPDCVTRLAGEVKEDTIYIYTRKENEALETLRHEFLDYSISQLILPYKEVTNKLISIINEESYRMKEKLVNNLSALLEIERNPL